MRTLIKLSMLAAVNALKMVSQAQATDCILREETQIDTRDLGDFIKADLHQQIATEDSLGSPTPAPRTRWTKPRSTASNIYPIDNRQSLDDARNTISSARPERVRSAALIGGDASVPRCDGSP